MDWLRFSFAVAILCVWIAVCAAAVHDPRVIALATVVTPVMLLPAGWLFTDGYLRARRGRRRDELRRSEDAEPELERRGEER